MAWGNKKKQEELDRILSVWNTLDQHLAAQGYNASTKLFATRIIPIKNEYPRIPTLTISVDMQNRLLVFTKLTPDELRLTSEILPFNKIIGGEILIGGRSSSSYSRGGASAAPAFGTNNMAFASTFSFTSTDTSVGCLEYKIKTNDMLNPIYTAVLYGTSIIENSPLYRELMDVAIRLDTIIQQIVAEQNK